MNLDALKMTDELRQFSLKMCSGFLHKEHRWVLPIIHYAQEKGTLHKPCTLIMFDAHHDSKDPICIEEISRVMETGINFESLIRLCQNNLSQLNDDWVKAAMELGFIDNAVIFGVKNQMNDFRLKSFLDRRGNKHKIELMGFPGDALGHQGSLSDLAQKENLSDLWDILDWECTSKAGFTFPKDAKKILLDFDLDYFVIEWEHYILPWPDEIFEDKFFRESKYWSTQGWTGKRFLTALMDRASLVTITMEPKFCGGEKKANEILERVNHFLFDDNLRVAEF